MSEAITPQGFHDELDERWREGALERWREGRPQGGRDGRVGSLAPRILQRVSEAIRTGAPPDGTASRGPVEPDLSTMLRDLRDLWQAALDELQSRDRCHHGPERALVDEVFDRTLAGWLREALLRHVEEERSLRAAAETSAAECGALQHRLLEEQEIREGFVAAVVHDLRSPLTAVSFALEILDRPGSDPTMRDKALARARRGVERIDHLAQRLLDANRLSSTERFPLRLQTMDLAAFCLQLVDDLAHLAGPERLVYDGPASGVTGAWDEGALHGILENLIRNALKYGDDSPITLRLRASDDEVVVAVHNSGPPIAAEDQPRIFERFVRLDAARHQGSGWGIGLALARGLSREHGGDVEVDSSAEHGTTFTVRLPRHLA